MLSQMASFSAVPDGIGAKQSKFGDAPADLGFF